MTDQPNPAAVEPQAPHADGGSTDFETETEQNNSLSMTIGASAPPSPTLDTEDGSSDWDPEKFTPPTLEEMPTEGPGSPGYDVYAPENAKWEDPNWVDPEADHDEEDVQAAIDTTTADGVGETDPKDLPASDVDPNEEAADDYPDLEPRGEDLPEKKDNA